MLMYQAWGFEKWYLWSGKFQDILLPFDVLLDISPRLHILPNQTLNQRNASKKGQA